MTIKVLKTPLVILTMLAAIATGILCIYFFQNGYKEYLLVLGLAWSVGAPLWFLLEYSCRYEKFKTNKKSNELEERHFKYLQELTKNIWLGMVVVIFAAISTIDESCECDCKPCIKKTKHEVTTAKD